MVFSVQSVEVGLGGRPVISDITFTVSTGEVLSIIGPSGCGKTTLLRCACSLISPDTGAVLLDGAPVNPGGEAGLVFQEYALFPWFTAAANIEAGLRMQGVPRRERRKVAEMWMERLRITNTANRYPAELSGGERQRVALARTLTLNPRVLLLDEPFSALDAITREELQDLSADVLAEYATVLVTHSIEEAVYLGDRVAVMTPGPPGRFAGIISVPESRRHGTNRRTSRTYFQTCSSVRKLLESAGGIDAAQE